MLKLNLDNQPLVVSENAVNKLISIFYNEATKVYNKLPAAIQAMASTMARKKLYDMEREAYGKGASKDDAKAFRPAPQQDAALKLAEVMIGAVKVFLENAEIEIGISRDDHAEISDFTFQYKDTSETGG